MSDLTVGFAETFADTVPNYPMLPRVSKNLAGQDIDRHAQRARVQLGDVDKRDLTDEELLLTSPIVYGFSFSDKQWCEYPRSWLPHAEDHVCVYSR